MKGSYLSKSAGSDVVKRPPSGSSEKNEKSFIRAEAVNPRLYEISSASGVLMERRMTASIRTPADNTVIVII